MIEQIWFTPGFVAAAPPAVKLVRDTFRACSGEGYALACEALGAADLRALASRIVAPTLVICGNEESDAFKEAARWLAQNISQAHGWSSSRTAAHASVLEQPEVIETLLRTSSGSRPWGTGQWQTRPTCPPAGMSRSLSRPSCSGTVPQPWPVQARP